MEAESEFEVECVTEVASHTLRAGVSVSKRSVLAIKWKHRNTGRSLQITLS